jgi:hypothetical protein
VFGRTAGAVAAAATAFIILGCMNFTFGTRSDDPPCVEPPDGDAFTQTGCATVRGKAKQDIYYPVPYAFPPNLEATDNFGHCEVVEQRADHFRVRNRDGLDATVRWTARGVRYDAPAARPPTPTPSGAPVPAPPAATLRPPELPAEPAPAR